MRYRTTRALPTDEEPNARGGYPSQLVSIRDVTYEHQKAAMVQGYNSMAEFAIDELLKIVAEMGARIDRLEQQLALVRGEIDELP